MKRISFIFGFLFLVSVASAQVNIDSGLVAFYPFDGNANDSTSFANHAINVSGAFLVPDRNNNDSSAYCFDGVDDYIEILHQEQISFSSSEQLAISLWIKAPKDQNMIGGSRILDKWDGRIQTNYPYGLTIASQASIRSGLLHYKQLAGSAENSTINNSVILSTSALNDDNWHHVVLQRTKKEMMEIYIDGHIEGNIIISPGEQLENEANLFIGTNNPGLYQSITRPFTGCVDELRFFNRELSKDEIKILAANDSVYPILDTIRIQIVDTIKVMVYDSIAVLEVYDTITVQQTKYDTIVVYDTVSNNTSVKLFVNEVVFTGMEKELILSELNIFPNPANKSFTIMHESLDIQEIKIFNLTGHLVYTERPLLNKCSIDVNNLEGVGVYIIHVMTSQKEIILKILIE